MTARQERTPERSSLLDWVAKHLLVRGIPVAVDSVCPLHPMFINLLHVDWHMACSSNDHFLEIARGCPVNATTYH
jgi:hypothetical protein